MVPALKRQAQNPSADYLCPLHFPGARHKPHSSFSLRQVVQKPSKLFIPPLEAMDEGPPSQQKVLKRQNTPQTPSLKAMLQRSRSLDSPSPSHDDSSRYFSSESPLGAKSSRSKSGFFGVSADRSRCGSPGPPCSDLSNRPQPSSSKEQLPSSAPSLIRLLPLRTPGKSGWQPYT